MTDFSTQVRHQGTDFIIRNLADIDFYKLTMGYFIYKNYRDVQVEFSLTNRTTSFPLSRFINEVELREQIEHIRTLKWRQTDLFYLRGMNLYEDYMFGDDYINFLKNMNIGDIEYSINMNGDQPELKIWGSWKIVTFWELYILPTINELSNRYFMRQMSNIDIDLMYARATDKLANKLKRIKAEAPMAKISDFGLRRRHSFLWQRRAIELAVDILGDQFTGTSNIYMAMAFDLMPIGTNAHELPMVVTALYPDEDKKKAQYDILREWGDLYGTGLRIALSDTYGTQQFFNDMPMDLAQNVAVDWKGMRQDSGDPAEEALFFMDWLKKQGLSDDEIKSKVCIFSDGLDVDSIIRLANQFDGKLITPFGWGTKLTNDFEGCLANGNEVVPGTGRSFGEMFKPISLVCKVSKANDRFAVKLSNNVNKATGPSEEVDKYIKIFGNDGRGKQKVIV